MAQKTITKLSLSALALAGALAVFGGQGSASAMEVIDGTKYWTLDEMVEFKANFEAEIGPDCADDDFCYRDKLYEFAAERDTQYGALNEFYGRRFLVSSVNPGLETLSVYYSDKDWRSGMSYGASAIDPSLSEMYLVWVEPQVGSPSSKSDWLVNGIRYPSHLAGAEAATHILVDETEAANGTDWFPPFTERTYSVVGSKLYENTNHTIFFSIAPKVGSKIAGTASYDVCVRSENYKLGMDCRAMFGEGATFTYYPFAVASSTTATAPTSTTDPNPAQGNLASAGYGAVGSDATNGSDSSREEAAATTASDTSVTTPDTGQPTATSEAASELPWWGIIPAVLGLTTAIWFFWPKKTSKSPKLPKKS